MNQVLITREWPDFPRQKFSKTSFTEEAFITTEGLEISSKNQEVLTKVSDWIITSSNTLNHLDKNILDQLDGKNVWSVGNRDWLVQPAALKTFNYGGELADELGKSEVNSAVYIGTNQPLLKFQKKLNSLKAEISFVAAYATKSHPIRLSNAYNGLVFMSPSAVNAYLQANEPNEEEVFTIGQTTADACRPFWGKVHAPKNPSTSFIIQRIAEVFE